MCCANGHLKILTLILENIQTKDPSLLESLVNHKNCDGDTPLRIFFDYFKFNFSNKIGQLLTIN